MNTRTYVINRSSAESVNHLTVKTLLTFLLTDMGHDVLTEHKIDDHYIDVYDFTTGIAYQVGWHVRSELLKIVSSTQVNEVVHIKIPSDWNVKQCMKYLDDFIHCDRYRAHPWAPALALGCANPLLGALLLGAFHFKITLTRPHVK